MYSTVGYIIVTILKTKHHHYNTPSKSNYFHFNKPPYSKKTAFMLKGLAITIPHIPSMLKWLKCSLHYLPENKCYGRLEEWRATKLFIIINFLYKTLAMCRHNSVSVTVNCVWRHTILIKRFEQVNSVLADVICPRNTHSENSHRNTQIALRYYLCF